MPWNFRQIVDAEHNDPALYPVLSQQSDALPVELETLDGPVNSYAATGLQVSRLVDGNLKKRTCARGCSDPSPGDRRQGHHLLR